MSDLKDRIRAAMGTKTAEAVARESGLRGITIRRLATGATKTAPRLDTLEAVALALGVRPAWLAGWDDAE